LSGSSQCAATRVAVPIQIVAASPSRGPSGIGLASARPGKKRGTSVEAI
jgi:hypothetical protein